MTCRCDDPGCALPAPPPRPAEEPDMHSVIDAIEQITALQWVIVLAVGAIAGYAVAVVFSLWRG